MESAQFRYCMTNERPTSGILRRKVNVYWGGAKGGTGGAIALVHGWGGAHPCWSLCISDKKIAELYRSVVFNHFEPQAHSLSNKNLKAHQLKIIVIRHEECHTHYDCYL